ncbi:hypothetical protein SNE40_020601 [Patella caerulea]|uniref:Fibrinogen C-terminal domain-containing protein n=1 Tax=Patella caerulea TaxID=87958 RepID=A0AAN8P7C2_PATCE
MERSVRIIIYLYSCFVVVFAGRDSQYVQTKVYKEFESQSIFSEKTDSLLRCSVWCSSTVDCRRILYDKETKLCSLYDQGEHCLTDEAVIGKVCFRVLSICDEAHCERCPIGFYGDRCQHVIEDCADGTRKNVVPLTITTSFIRLSSSSHAIEVLCDFGHGGWTFILTRDGSRPEINFNRTWSEYVRGFGYRGGNHWLGLENVHKIIENHPRFKLQLFIRYGSPARMAFSHYSGFYICNVTDNYKIFFASFDENPNLPTGNSFTNGSYSINGRPFSTYDRDYSNYDCPGRFGGGWWFLDDPVCSRANVNGRRSGDNFESTWHWLDNLGNRTDLLGLFMKIFRETDNY